MMSIQGARKLGHEEETAPEPMDEKRRNGLAQIMAGIWHRHNPHVEGAGEDSDENQLKNYLAEIW